MKLREHCEICGGVPLSPNREPLSREPICMDCLEDVLRQEYLQELEPEDLVKLRRRIEELLRKTPQSLIEVAAHLGARGLIKYEDLL